MRTTNVNTGLTYNQVQQQVSYGNTNQVSQKNSTSMSTILANNAFTLFNFINLFIAILIFWTGSYMNLFFLLPVIANFLIGSYQEIKAKRELDRLTFLNRQKVYVLRDGKKQQIFQDELVLHDLIILSRGNQIPADGEVCQTSGIQVDESNLTGESNAVTKNIGDAVLSGSLVISGQALVELTAVGANSFANKLARSAKNQKHKASQLVDLINKIIKYLSYIIIPLGLILFIATFNKQHNINQAILGTSASIIGMIPQGLVLLTSVALAVGAMHLSRKNILVKSMTSLESLARIDTLCLDKTGTITTGNLKLHDVVSDDPDTALSAARKITLATKETNETARAILADNQQELSSNDILSIVPFSSDRKWSAANFTNGQYLAMGAPNFILSDEHELAKARQYAQQGLRVIAVVQADIEITNTISHPQTLGLILISDELRPTAINNFAYLRQQSVTIKIISGDDPETVRNIAQQAKVNHAEQAIDMSTIGKNPDYQQLVNNYTVFGRTLPNQKRELIKALQKTGHKTGMVGDGVNDVLAMRQSDCAIAIAGNSDAAENAADFVFLNKSFDSIIFVLNEGRRVINNIEQVASMYLIKTIYSVMLTLLFIFINANYPFHPAQMTPVNALTVGIPTFFLALQPDFRPPEGKFFRNVLQIALPAATAITLMVIAIVFGGRLMNLNYAATSTLSVIAISLIDFTALGTVSRPWNRGKKVVFWSLFVASFLIFGFWGKPFGLLTFLGWPMFLYAAILLIVFYPIFIFCRKIFGWDLVLLKKKK